MRNLPGSLLQIEDYKFKVGFLNIAQLMSATKGLTLAQVCEMTGIEPSTVQNWVKRGWVAHPVNKRYGEYQFARILIINMLRAGLQLEKIAALLSYINGSAEDREDDIIPDSELYTMLCVIIDEIEKNPATDAQKAKTITKATLEDYTEVYPGAKQKLENALTVMTLVYTASQIKSQSDELYNSILK